MTNGEMILSFGFVAFIFFLIGWGFELWRESESDNKRKEKEQARKRTERLTKIEETVFGREVDPFWGIDAKKGLVQRMENLEESIPAKEKEYIIRGVSPDDV